jgi:glycosyltransferase involved in cell wall biosynthesis
MKDHPTFLRAAALFTLNHEAIRFVCVGDGPADYRQELYALCRELCLANRVIWAGARRDMPAVYNALDIACSSSYGEGFPNVIGESMACGVPCVVTDVGDSASLVGDLGIVVSPKDGAALKVAFEQLLFKISHENHWKTDCRQRILETYSLPKMVASTEEALFRCIHSFYVQ